MNPGGNRFLTSIKEHYDKVIAMMVLLVLVVSVVLLVQSFGQMKHDKDQFDHWLSSLTPVNEHAEDVDPSAYQNAMMALQTPMHMILPEQDDREDFLWMFVPETRFNCRECLHPVPIEADVCPFCQTIVEQPEPEIVDHDGDGMPTWWELKHGLDPHDPTDAHTDLDGDGYTNLEEYLAGTDPTDPDSRPCALTRVSLKEISETRFALQFTSRVRTQSGFRFGLNYRLPDGQTKTDFASIGSNVAGFILKAYEEKIVSAEPPRLGREDRSELTLETPLGGTLVLVMNQPKHYIERTAHLQLDLHGEQTLHLVVEGQNFVLDERNYTVIAIDGDRRRVVIHSHELGKETTISQATGRGERVSDF